MRAKMVLVPLLLALCCSVVGKEKEPKDKSPTQAELAAVTARGRMLVEYDVAAWHATDAIEDLKPDKALAPFYIAKKTDKGWVVAFGRLSEGHDKFLIVYEADQGTRPQFFTDKKYDPPIDNTDFFFNAAKGIEKALADFGPMNRPYNTYAIPSETDKIYVYLLPAQTKNGIYPLGGDVRYTLSADGSTILEKHQMHKSILEIENSAGVGQTIAAGTHSHVLTNSVEDSDVFHVLSRRPLIPEYVGTPDKHVYEVNTDGSIRRVH